MSILLSLAQMVECLKGDKNLQVEEKIKEELIRERIVKLRNYLVVIINEKEEEIYLLIEDEDRDARLNKVVDAFKKYNIIPKSTKGGHFSFRNIKVISRKFSKKSSNFNLEFEKLKEDIKRKFKLEPERAEDIVNKIRSKIEENRKIERLLILSKPIKQEIDFLEIKNSGKKGRCMLCGKEGWIIEKSLFSEIFVWLVKPEKNIFPIYNHNREEYCSHIKICEECAKIIKAKLGYFSLDRNFLKFFKWRLKIFLSVNMDELKKGLIDEFERLNKGVNESLDSIIEEYYLGKNDIKGESLFLNFLVYVKEQNKFDIIELIEDIRLSNLINLYRIFRDFKESRNISEKYVLIGKNSILSFLSDEAGYDKDIILSILKRLLRLEKIDDSLLRRVFSTFNRLSKKKFISGDRNDLRDRIVAIRFLEYYNKRIEKYLNINIKR